MLRRAEVEDGGEDALVVFDANVLALFHSCDVLAADACGVTDLVTRDVQAATFGAEDAAEMPVGGAKIHCGDVLLG